MPKTDLGASTTTDLWATFHFKTQGREKLQVVTSGFFASTQHRSADAAFHEGVITFDSEAAKHMVKMYNPASPSPKQLKRETIQARTLNCGITPCWQG